VHVLQNPPPALDAANEVQRQWKKSKKYIKEEEKELTARMLGKLQEADATNICIGAFDEDEGKARLTQKIWAVTLSEVKDYI
jgi:hypothetical protein